MSIHVPVPRQHVRGFFSIYGKVILITQILTGQILYDGRWKKQTYYLCIKQLVKASLTLPSISHPIVDHIRAAGPSKKPKYPETLKLVKTNCIYWKIFEIDNFFRKKKLMFYLPPLLEESNPGTVISASKKLQFFEETKRLQSQF